MAGSCHEDTTTNVPRHDPASPGDSLAPGDAGSCLGTFVVVTTGSFWYGGGGARDVFKTHRVRTAPQRVTQCPRCPGDPATYK